MKKRRGWSLGTILTLCLTVAVAVGYLLTYARIKAQPTGGSTTAGGPVVAWANEASSAETRETGAQESVRTVTVTLAPSATATPAPEITVPPVMHYDAYAFDLTLGGVIAYQSDISASLFDNAAKTIDYSSVLSLLSPKIHADLNMVTFGQLIHSDSMVFDDVNVPAAAADALRTAGFDDVILCTEHALDQGESGAAQTVSALNARGLSCGGVTAGGAQQNRLLQLNGAKIAVLAYTDVLTAKGKNAREAKPSLLKMYDQETARRDIQTAKAQGASLVIVWMHWGRADTASVTNAQREKARALAEMGADVILGTRPTRVLPMELITSIGADGYPRQTFVAYSMGTLVTENRNDGYAISGVLLHLHISGDEQGRIRFGSAEYTPTYIWCQRDGGKTSFRVVCSADPAPEGMDDRQKTYMQNAYNRIRETLQNCPVSMRQ